MTSGKVHVQLNRNVQACCLSRKFPIDKCGLSYLDKIWNI